MNTRYRVFGLISSVGVGLIIYYALHLGSRLTQVAVAPKVDLSPDLYLNGNKSAIDAVGGKTEMGSIENGISATSIQDINPTTAYTTKDWSNAFRNVGLERYSDWISLNGRLSPTAISMLGPKIGPSLSAHLVSSLSVLSISQVKRARILSHDGQGIRILIPRLNDLAQVNRDSRAYDASITSFLGDAQGNAVLKGIGPIIKLRSAGFGCAARLIDVQVVGPYDPYPNNGRYRFTDILINPQPGMAVDDKALSELSMNLVDDNRVAFIQRVDADDVPSSYSDFFTFENGAIMSKVRGSE
jgi:hypothetical protein